MPKRQKLLVLFCWLLLPAISLFARQDQPAEPPPQSAAEFMQAADEVLVEMSKVLSLPVLRPLKKSVRSREEIRDYLIHSMKEEKNDAKRDADQKTLELLGLIPKGYALDQKLLSLLTEQVAGLYDPKSREFFIADWTSLGDQRMIMAHELTHALQDQHFHVQKWVDEVKRNDDATLARTAVLEGSATVAMLDYLLRGTGKSSRDVADLDPSLLLGDATDSPELADAPQILRDEMLFPYLPGATFIQHLLKAWDGWPSLHKVFENPPVSTQQILHPDLYLRGVVPEAVVLPPVGKILPHDWKKLDENVLGEFGVNEVLKQFIGKERADNLAAAWDGDRYAVFERQGSGRIIFVLRIHFRSDADSARFFGGYSEVLERKDKERTGLLRRPNFFSFEAPAGGVFLRCAGADCLTAEGTTRAVFESMTAAIGWPAGPVDPRQPAEKVVTVKASRPARTMIAAAAGMGTCADRAKSCQLQQPQ